MDPDKFEPSVLRMDIKISREPPDYVIETMV